MTETFIRMPIYIPYMRKVEVVHGKITLTDEVEVVYERRVTPHGNSAKVDAQKKYIGRRAYVIILKEGS
jgi:putative transposon-encoded protein